MPLSTPIPSLFSKPGKVSSLQTMRLFAALGVFQYHLWHNYLGVFVGLPATDYFLVLVGVLAAMTQADRIGKGNWWGYIQTRYIRLYVTFIPFFLLTLAWKWQDADWGWILQSFFLLPIAERTPVIGATWMLSQFLLFYFLFSIAYVLKKESSLWVVFSLWTMGTVAFNFLGWKPPLAPHWAQTIFYERNLEFVFGYITGLILRQNRIPLPWGRRIFWVGAVGIAASIILQNNGISPLGRSFYSGIPITLFVLGLVSLEQQGAQDRTVKILTWPWLVLAGESSYVLYLSHGTLLQAWDRIFTIVPSYVPLITLFVVFISVLGYRYWEKPMINFLNKQVWIFPKFSTLPGFVKDTQSS